MDLHSEIPLDVPAKEAWAVLGAQFGDIGQWATSIQRSHLDRPLDEGAVRTCEIQGFGPIGAATIHERLTHFDPSTMAFTYEVVSGLPPMFRRAINRWRIHPDGPTRCRVTSHATVTLVWWAAPFGWWIRRQFASGSRDVSRDLEHRVRNGVPHPQKLAS
ncbi:MAG: SRPBCC family protein [Myxococcota bacterium]